MARRLTYTIGFTAETDSLVRSISQAAQQLQTLGSQTRLTTELQEAGRAALELRSHLQRAVDVTNDKFDLIKFDEGLRRSGLTLADYEQRLRRIGPEGERAFIQLAQAITSAELPIKRANKLLDSLWLTMKNTARWQLTSSMLHSFIGGVQTAYGYTKDLNESLNNIRIVTEKSTEQMSQFAAQANKAAKALSTTTLDYTDASLIYYQQGLPEADVQERTEATIKFANVSRQSAEVASEQLTSIWNNFYDGTKSLEYYIDVMVKLGAATASSSEEISQGVQKFAATADTIGLSYEYAAAALATVTATTRQSADIVGTAFRTLFARIQDLELGKTLEDGTTLGKYAAALEAVGVNIKDSNDELKDMDTLLDEIGDKWKTIEKDQQVALAQQVAGVRQYTQLMALLDNWSFFQENLSSAYGAEGTLDEQADVYAESWEAARDRVRAASEDIYDSLINEQFFIDLDNSITPVLSGIAKVIDAFGGMGGTATVVGNIIFSLYHDKIASSMRELVGLIGMASGSQQRLIRQLQTNAANLAQATDLAAANSNDSVFSRRMEALQQEARMRASINNHIDNMNSLEKESISLQLQTIENLKTITNQQAENLNQTREQVREYQETLMQHVNQTPLTSNNRSRNDINNFLRAMDTGTRGAAEFNNFFQQMDIALQNILNRMITLQERASRLTVLSNAFHQANFDAQLLNAEMQELAVSLGYVNQQGGFDPTLITDAGLTRELRFAGNDIQTLRRILDETVTNFPQYNVTVREFMQSIQNLGNETVNTEINFNSLLNQMNQMSDSIDNNTYHITDSAIELANLGQRILSVATALNGIRSAYDMVRDADLSNIERIITLATNFGMILPVLSSGIEYLNTQKQFQVRVGDQLLRLTESSISTTLTEIFYSRLSTQAVNEETAAIQLQTAARRANLLAISMGIVALAGVAAAVYYAAQDYNKTSIALKEATEALDDLTTASERATNAAQQLRDTLSSWKSEESVFKSLDRDAEEYEESLERLNEKARELIETYNLFGQYSYSPQGQIQFNPGVLEELQAKADQEEQFAKEAMYRGQTLENEARIANEVTYTRRSLNTEGYLDDNDVYRIIDFFKQYENIDAIPGDQLAKDLNEFMPRLALTTDTINSFRKSIINLSQSIDQTKDANSYYIKEILKLNLSDYKKNFEEAANSSGMIDMLMEVLAQKFSAIQIDGQTFKEAYENIELKAVDYSNPTLGVTTDENLARTYAREVLGRSDADQLGYSGGFGTGSLSDGEQKIFDDLSDDYMRRQIALHRKQQEVIEKFTAASESFDAEKYSIALTDFVNKITSFGDAFDTSFEDVVLSALTTDNPSEIDFSSLAITDDIKEAISTMSYEDSLKASGLTEQDFINAGIDNGAAWWEGFQQGIDEYDLSLFYERIAEAGATGEKSARAFMEDVRAGDVNYSNILENEEYTNLIKSLETVKKEFPELEDEYLTLSKTWLIGTQNFIDALEIVQDKLSNVKLKKLSQEAKEASDDVKEYLGKPIDISANTDKFMSAMNKLLDAEFSVDVEIHTQAEQEFDSIVAAMKDIEEKSSMMGENFIVAAEDVRALNNTFPGIVAGLEDLGNGSVRINRQVAQAAIDAAKAEIAADTEATIQKLTLQATTLESKQKIYLEMAKAAEVLANAEYKSSEGAAGAQAVISANLSRLEQENSKVAADKKDEYNIDVADSSYVNAGVVADNWGKAYSEATKASAEFARAAIKNNMLVESNGDISEVSEGNIRVNYKGSTGIDNETSVIDEVNSLLEEDVTNEDVQKKWAEIAELLNNLAASAGTNANDIRGMIYEIGARTIELGQSFDDIGKKKSSGNTKDKEALKQLDDEIDRYHVINREIEYQSTLLDELDKKISSIYGLKRLDKFEDKTPGLNWICP